jgi:hypothetical protein
MTDEIPEFEPARLRDTNSYEINSLADEIRVDRLCSLLLRQFHRHLLENGHCAPLAAGSLASGADYFLREFMIGHRRSNIFNATADHVRRFAGHWYIVSNLEPNLTELNDLLQGTAAFYGFCAELQLVAPETAESIRQACGQLDSYQQRIESFHAITEDGFRSWEENCP